MRMVGTVGTARTGERQRGTGPTHPDHRPRLRGMVHAWSFWLAIPACGGLVVAARPGVARWSAVVYVGSLLAMLGTSAAYHRLGRTERSAAVLRRLDHAMILVLIAGSMTPVALVGLPRATGIPMMWLMWLGAAAGLVMKVWFFDRAPIVNYGMYLVLGWMTLIALPAMLDHLTVAELVLIGISGALYTGGFPVLLVRRPDPWPTVFGYHEIWHTCVALAAACHLAAVWLIIT